MYARKRPSGEYCGSPSAASLTASYRPVFRWITDYAGSHIDKSRIDLGFEYINTSSTKWIFNILKELAVMPEVSENVG